MILSQLVPDHSIQANLFGNGQENRRRILMEAMDNINFSQRDDIVKYVASGLTRN